MPYAANIDRSGAQSLVERLAPAADDQLLAQSSKLRQPGHVRLSLRQRGTALLQWRSSFCSRCAKCMSWAGIGSEARPGPFDFRRRLVSSASTSDRIGQLRRQPIGNDERVLGFGGAVVVLFIAGGDAVSWPRAIALLALFGAAVATKEHTAVLPALFLLTDFWWNPGFSLAGIRRNWRLYVPIVLGSLGAVAFVLRALRHRYHRRFQRQRFHLVSILLHRVPRHLGVHRDVPAADRPERRPRRRGLAQRA